MDKNKSMNVNPKFRIMGVDVDAITIPLAIDQIMAVAANPETKACYVVKPYVEFMERCIREPEFIAVLNQASWCLPDGIALNWAAHYLYGSKHGLIRLYISLAQIVLMPARVRDILPERFGGISFTWPLLEAAAKNNSTLYLIGSPKNNSITKTVKAIQDAIPGLNICGFYNGQLDKRLEQKLLVELQRLKPDIILIGMGFPTQEKLIRRLLPDLDHGVLIGEGGSFDYQQFGGQTKRAPVVMQKLGLEWLWRLMLEPSRLLRQLSIATFIWHIYQQGKAPKAGSS